jgi:hypothetical protein
MELEIPLTQNKVALVDGDVYDTLSKFKWCASKQCNTYYAFHAFMRPDKTYNLIGMHRMVISIPNGFRCDHINGNGLDNRKCNLRVVTIRGNAQNQHVKKSSKFPGVSWYPKYNKWVSKIRVNDTRHHLGYFIEEHDAYKAYVEACNKFEV